LIAAKLNITSGADGSAVAATISAADALIGGLIVPSVGGRFLAGIDYKLAYRYPGQLQ
jgi:hypothetical protein